MSSSLQAAKAMPVSPSLQPFCQHLQDWDEAVAQGAAALATLQRVYGELEPPKDKATAPEILQRLMQLAPSFRFESYLCNMQSSEHSRDVQLSADMHAAYISLQDAVATAKQELSSMQEITDNYAKAALAEELPLPPPQEQQQQDNGQVNQAAACTTAATAEDQGEVTASDAAAAAAAVPQMEELALLLSALVGGLQQELQWMELVAASITLDTTPEDLSTFSIFWELQPFTDEAAVAFIRKTAAATAEEDDSSNSRGR